MLRANVEHALAQPFAPSPPSKYALVHGDARELARHLDALRIPEPFALVVNNPPYWGDQSQVAMKSQMNGQTVLYPYSSRYANLAFLKESDAYFAALGGIYAECARRLRKGGRLVVGVKDQMRDRKPDMLHARVADVLASIRGLSFEGVALLRHHPTTLHLNTYEKRTGVKPPFYQTIVVFRKRSDG